MRTCSCGGLLRRADRCQLTEGAGEAVGAQVDVEAVDADVDPRDQQLNDARLLGGEEFIQRGSSRSSASRTSASLMSPIDWRATARGRLLRGGCGKLPADARGLRGSRCKPGLDQCLAA